MTRSTTSYLCSEEQASLLGCFLTAWPGQWRLRDVRPPQDVSLGISQWSLVSGFSLWCSGKYLTKGISKSNALHLPVSLCQQHHRCYHQVVEVGRDVHTGVGSGIWCWGRTQPWQPRSQPQCGVQAKCGRDGVRIQTEDDCLDSFLSKLN